jgi:hypothetical protein
MDQVYVNFIFKIIAHIYLTVLKYFRTVFYFSILQKNKLLSLNKKMKSFFYTLIISITLFACNKPTGIKEIILSSDSVAINYFKGNGSMDTVTNVILLKDKNQINQLADFVESSTTNNGNCGYDGSLHFFKNNMVLQDVDFRMNDVQCMTFSFLLYNGKKYSTTLSPEAKQFLVSANK